MYEAFPPEAKQSCLTQLVSPSSPMQFPAITHAQFPRQNGQKTPSPKCLSIKDPNLQRFVVMPYNLYLSLLVSSIPLWSVSSLSVCLPSSIHPSLRLVLLLCLLIMPCLVLLSPILPPLVLSLSLVFLLLFLLLFFMFPNAFFPSPFYPLFDFSLSYS